MTKPPGEGTPPERPDEPRPGEQQPWEQPGTSRPEEPPTGAQPPGASRPGEPPTGEQPPGTSRPGEYEPGYWERQGQQGQQQGQVPYPPYQGQPYPPPGYPGQVQYAPDHPRATTSLVVGILGVVLCQLAAPFAWWMGKKTLDEIDASQGTVGGRGAAQAGYILGIVGTVLLALGVIFGILWIIFMVAVFRGGVSTSP